jgi:hypothetical protein
MKHKVPANFASFRLPLRSEEAFFNSRRESSSCSYRTGNATHPLKSPQCSVLTSTSHWTEVFFLLEMLLELSHGRLKEEESWMGNCGISSAEDWMKNFVPSVAAAGLRSRGASSSASQRPIHCNINWRQETPPGCKNRKCMQFLKTMQTSTEHQPIVLSRKYRSLRRLIAIVTVVRELSLKIPLKRTSGKRKT